MSDSHSNILDLPKNLSHVFKDRMKDMKRKDKSDHLQHNFQTNTVKEPHERQNNFQKFNTLLTGLLYRLGSAIAASPNYFILVPVCLTLVSLTGLQQQIVESDFEKLWYPSGGAAPYERDVIEQHFPVNYSSFIPYHATRIQGFTRVFMTAQDGGTIFRVGIWREMMGLDDLIRNLTIEDDQKTFSYYDLCTMWRNECFQNEVFKLDPYIKEIENGSMRVNYPVMFVPMIVPMYFGGMDIDTEHGYINSAKAISASYFLRLDTKQDQIRSKLWEKKFLQTLQNLTLENINITQATSTSVDEETSKNIDGLGPLIPIMVLLMAGYSILSVMSGDWVRSKPYIGLTGIVVSVMGTFTAFGLLSYIQIPTSGLNGTIPFLMLGIGLDDMFVVLSAWSRTHLQSSVEVRLGETYAEAGVSITITSLTNIISFTIGLITPVPAVRCFCLYAAISLTVVYIWHMTLFGACLAIAGRLEQDQRHSLLCMKVSAKSVAETKRPSLYSILCAGGVNPYDPWNPKDNTDPRIKRFFRDTLAEWLVKWQCQCLLLSLYCIYMAGAIYGCTQVKEGLDRFKVVPHDSYAVEFFQIEDKMFRKFPYNIQVAITGDIEYSDPKIQDKIMKLHGQMEDLPYIYKGIFTQSYIRSWYRYLERKPDIKRTIRNESDFVTALSQKLKRESSNRRALDVAFNADGTKISAVRFILQSFEVNDTMADQDMMLMLRSVAANFTDLNVTVFNPNFILFDQYGGVRASVIQATLIAAASMVVISLIFIPNPMCSVVVGFSIISIQIGVIGFMSLWGVNLDPVSTITLIMCIGFSVDFSAHISYSYLASKAPTPKAKLKESLFCLGFPILQGGTSTILCVVCFAFVPSYVYRAFFKVVVIVISSATLHGLLFIPALLTVLDTIFQKHKQRVTNDTVYDKDAPIIISVKSLMPAIEAVKLPKVLEPSPDPSRRDPEGCSDNDSDRGSINTQQLEEEVNETS